MYPGKNLLFDGETELLTLPRMSLAGLAELGDRMSLIGKGLTVESAGALTDALWISLKRNYPALPRITVENGITVENYGVMIGLFVEVNDLRPKTTDEKTAEAGNPAAV
jgi:hypothetical protein